MGNHLAHIGPHLICAVPAVSAVAVDDCSPHHALDPHFTAGRSELPGFHHPFCPVPSHFKGVGPICARLLRLSKCATRHRVRSRGYVVAQSTTLQEEWIG